MASASAPNVTPKLPTLLAKRVVLLLPAVLLIAGCGPSRQQLAAEQRATLARYCFDCHGNAEREADLSLEALDVDDIAGHGAVWERVVRKLATGMMPPHDGGPRPQPAEAGALLAWLEGELDGAAAESPDPGRTVPLHRLNRSEYRNAVRDLLAVDVDVAALLPGDDASYGFDNIGGVLKLSPTLLERYLSAADKISRLAVGTDSPFVTIDSFRIPDDRSQERRLPDLPFGTRGGIRIDYTVPQDAEYSFSAALARDLNEGMPIYTEPQILEVSIDRERVATFTLDAANALPLKPEDSDDFGGRMNRRVAREEQQARNRADENWSVRVPVAAGRREVAITFVDKAASIPTGKREPFGRPFPRGLNIPEGRYGSYLRRVEIAGPYDATGPGRTASRERIFVCRPAADEPHVTEDAESCAKTILGSVVRRAYRRPVTGTDVEPFVAFYRAAHADEGSFDGGIQVALKAVLVSPEFLFRVERDPEGAAPGSVYRIGDVELASRLSFFLWSSIPDDELLLAAERGALGQSAELERQVRRMIADPRADAFVANFAGQWLYLRNLEAVIPVQSIFPNFDDTLREGLRRETELFFASVLREDSSVLDLLDADYTFVNERVAKHYGLPNVQGSHFRRVQLPADSPRRGLLGHGSVLAVTSHADRTSPVVRGHWILENLLGAAPPPPPANVPPLDATSVTDGNGTMLSLRERLAVHRGNPSCASCHTPMDSVGFALEGFDATGRWRTIDELGDPVDASGVLPDGSVFEGLDEFRSALLDSEQFRIVLAEKLMVYAVGRGLEHYDMPAVRAIVRDAAADGHRFSKFLLGVVNSAPFKMRRAAS
jgi:mono/diheme cytochrome c family protein